MIFNSLGNTGIKVSQLCFGSLTIGPLQKDLPLPQGVEIINRAAELGVNFIDTADLYGTYPYIKETLKSYPEMVVASKSYAYDKKTAEETLNRAIKGIGRDYIDIFLLHEQEGPYTLKGHWEAMEYLIKCKEKGMIRGIGLSTHYVAGVKAGAITPEVDIIHPILNYKGLGIVDGTLDHMEKAIEMAWHNGKGIYAMKPLGGGHLISSMQDAFDYILDFPYIHSIATGMQRIQEVETNIQIFNGQLPSTLDLELLKGYKRHLFIHDWCIGCGKCIERCQHNALSLGEEGKAQVDLKKCILCGYCSTECSELAIKVI